MDKHTVVCVLTAKPDKQEDLKKALMNVVTPSRDESTCLEYRLHQDINDPCKFLLFENWTSKADHEKQFEKSYILDLVGVCEQTLAKPYEAHLLSEIA